ncbi:hypothetical protein EX30DRAFT_395907 [Ascodesmis nigricans]|uniref:Protein YOP1 n=1 Tax=Ascodesmis nigricans TaxID=341454 RepID=A0A4S2MWQ6_9PEZI|nr:hypothetical protein EX30DRAFT_395907 [Ascodesmis nigricans]
MFGLISQLLCSIASFIFPVFASFKALNANDPAQLTPWLMYWVVLACFLVVEAWTGWILVWIPFYYEVRAVFLLWLVLPQTQGATKLYLEYVHPTLTKHEKDIEDFISRTHEHARTLGIEYIHKLIRYVKQAVLGQLAEEPPAPPPKEPSNFAQSLFARWRVPPLSSSAPQLANDFYSFLSSALQQQTMALANDPGMTGRSPFGTLIPSNITSKTEKARFIELQKQRLNTVLAALEKESSKLQSSGETSAAGAVDTAEDTPPRFFKSPSQGNLSSHDGDFERVDTPDEQAAAAQGKVGSGGWLWGWGQGGKGAKAHDE